MEQRFELRHASEPWRVVRGRVGWPAGGGLAPWVLVLHGFKGFMDWGFFPLLAQRLVRRGLCVVRFNHSGSGIGADLETFSDAGAFRRATLSRELEDIERVRAWIEQGKVGRIDPRRKALLGHSRGGGMALVHAARSGDYDAVVTWAAVDGFGRWDAATVADWRREGVLPVHNARTGQTLEVSSEVLEDYERHKKELDVLAACGRLHAPLLAIHGSEDEAVEPEALERIASAASRSRVRKLLVRGAGHTFGATHPLGEVTPRLELVLRETEDFLAQHLGAET